MCATWTDIAALIETHGTAHITTQAVVPMLLSRA